MPGARHVGYARSFRMRNEEQTVNQKTAKMLKRWAIASGKTTREVKRWWLSLNRFEREAEGRKIRAKND